MKKVFLLLFLWQSVSMAAPFQATPQTPTLVAKAQQAYLDGDFSVAVNTLKQAYMASVNDSVAIKNIMQMFTKIRTMSPAPRFDVGWTLPAEIKSMRVSVSRRMENGLITHQLMVSGGLTAPDDMDNFQVVRYPDTIVLDKAKKVGTFHVSNEDGTPDFDFRSRGTAFDVSSGLYLMTFSTKGGAHVDGWFMLDENSNSTAQPQITNLDGNPVFDTGTPLMKWNEFTSPQFKKDIERRTLSIWIGKANEDKGVWSFWTENVKTTSATIGSTLPIENGWDHGPLENGDYYALLNYMESQSFGPIRIVRRSGTVKYFSVKR